MEFFMASYDTSSTVTLEASIVDVVFVVVSKLSHKSEALPYLQQTFKLRSFQNQQRFFLRRWKFDANVFFSFETKKNRSEWNLSRLWKILSLENFFSSRKENFWIRVWKEMNRNILLFKGGNERWRLVWRNSSLTNF